MGWNAQVILVRAPRDEAVDLLDLMGVVAQTVSFDEAVGTSYQPNAGVTQVGEWTVVAGGPPGMPWHAETRDALAQCGDVFIGVLSGVTSEYWIWWLTGGKQARHVGWSTGENIADEGEPLPAEVGIQAPSWGYD